MKKRKGRKSGQKKRKLKKAGKFFLQILEKALVFYTLRGGKRR